MVVALPPVSELALARLQRGFFRGPRHDLPAAAGHTGEPGNAPASVPLHGPPRVEAEHHDRATHRAGAALAGRYTAARSRALDLFSGDSAAAACGGCPARHACAAFSDAG